ncbi:helix-turn-helix domain-containing protein [Streptomyces sp. NBC_01255]|uniref:helix-turn-helix domain-containing protein n=1 Tax=Streptomyces sp. NBC_01255 TaxID=2903798 RepID=UPI002E31F054|nr:helix-turn-helix domain-containing protein [Streptomyces sp. NBC_01255]
MNRFTEAERFAARLRELRQRADYSYEVLAQKSGTSRSSLHRYCTGSSVPQDYGSAHRIAVACGATPAELRELHRLWALADAERAEALEPTEPVESVEPAEPVEPVEPVEPPPPVEVASPPEEKESEPAEPTVTEPEPDHEPAPARRTPRRLLVALAVTGLVLALTAWGVSVLSSPPEGTAPEPCGPVVSMGQNDECVRDVQERLRDHGARIGVDGSFGPETLRRVTAFQVLAGLVPNGVVGDPTKKALRESPVRMETWAPEKVRQRVREVFTEAPDDAVAIADCQSFLDPLHILPNTNGSRNWGVFQISDARLAELGGTPAQALDPEWNIQAARKLWSRERDFGDWPHCERALTKAPATPSASASR